MCDLITFAPTSPEIPLPERARGVHAGRQLHIEKFVNAGSGHEHPGKSQVFSLTSGGCSCGLLPEAEDIGQLEQDEIRLRHKANKLHWSKAKTERAVADSRASTSVVFERTAVEKAVRTYLADVAEACAGLSLIVHCHRGSFTSERFSVLREEKISSAQLRSDSRFIQNDVRYVVRP